MRASRRVVGMVVSLVLLSATGACDTLTYIAHVTSGQLGVQSSVEPIETVLADGRLSAQEEAKLRLIVEARQFAIDVIGLDAGESYTTYYDTRGNPLSFNLSAAGKDALVPFVWSFPFVGTIPYLGFFDQAYAESVQGQLRDMGYDTVLYEVDAYSTLGLFADPVRSPMLQRGDISLADTIVHELLHNTIWRNEDTEFNESLATFVGRTGGVQFLQHKFGAQSDVVARAQTHYADLDRINRFLFDLYFSLDDYYAQPISKAEKVAGREAVYQAGRNHYTSDVLPLLSDVGVYAGFVNFPTNNAWMLGNYRYNLDLDLFKAVFDATGQSWPDSLDAFRQATGTDDPKGFLRAWLVGKGITPPARDLPLRAVHPTTGGAACPDGQPCEYWSRLGASYTLDAGVAQ